MSETQAQPRTDTMRTVRLQRRLDAQPYRVYRAWSSPDALTTWFPDAVEGSLAVRARSTLVFPSRRTLEESDDPTRALEEERRLAYVAWTRARKSLLLVYDPTAPSVFMREAFSDAELGLVR